MVALHSGEAFGSFCACVFLCSGTMVWFIFQGAPVWVAMSDYRLYWWRSPVVTRGSRGVLGTFLKKTEKGVIRSY